MFGDLGVSILGGIEITLFINNLRSIGCCEVGSGDGRKM